MVGYCTRFPVDLKQRTWFFGTASHDPPWPVILDAPRDQPHPIGEQRRSDGITDIAHVSLSVELESDRFGAINLTACRYSIRLIQPESSGFGSVGL